MSWHEAVHRHAEALAYIDNLETDLIALIKRRITFVRKAVKEAGNELSSMQPRDVSSKVHG